MTDGIGMAAADAGTIRYDTVAVALSVLIAGPVADLVLTVVIVVLDSGTVLGNDEGRRDARTAAGGAFTPGRSPSVARVPPVRGP
ncbi:hypothetical protein [Streptomyces sp. NPDC058632]|uniref:hypothetical protein n=1 Tax=Streptomyces sp. NPDC058632 TaxID=3346567 RepID=UPI0036505590